MTGGAGFIGSHIGEALVKRGDKVRVLDNLLTGKTENLAPFLDRIEVHRRRHPGPRDLPPGRAGASTMSFTRRPCLPSLARSKIPVLTQRDQRHGHAEPALGRRDAGVRSFVFASSSSVYGDEPELPEARRERREGPCHPTPSASSWARNTVRSSTSIFGLKTVALRYFNVFGPRQDPVSQYAAVVPLFITKVLHGRSARSIYGDGEQSRDFIYVENVAEANLLAARPPARWAAKSINIACGERLTVNALLAAVNEVLGTDVRPVYADARPGDIKHSTADIGKGRRLMGYEPGVSFMEGLKETIAWYKKRS